MAWYTSACPRNCYSTCGLLVEVVDGRIRRIEPHPANRATGRGLCLKGLSYIERVYSPDRLLAPLARTPDGFRRITWEEALDTIAARLRSIRERFGPRAVLYYSGSGTKGLLNGAGLAFWRMFGGCTTTYGDLCWPAGLEATRLTLGDNRHNAPWDLENARLIILWGKNAAETNVHQMRHIDAALAHGARLVAIDPRRTESAERAHLLIQPRPGTDGALALAAAHVLVREGWIDEPFIEAHVLGFAGFSEMVRECTPEWAGSITGVPADAIEELASAIHESPPASIVAGFGMQRYTNSGQTMRAMISLLAITGQIGKPGAGWMYANLQTQIFGGRDPLAFFPPAGAHEGAAVRVSVSAARLGPDILAQTDPPLKFAWVERGNPIPQNPETPAVIDAFRRMEFRVVVDEFLTDTAREADVVLPAKSLFEQTDVIGAYWHPYLQLKQKVIEPPGEVKPETEIYRALAAQLGFDQREVDEAIPGPGDEAVQRWLARKLAAFPGVTLERLREGPVLAPGAEDIAFADLRFPTPSGRIELCSEEAARRWGVDPLPRYSEAFGDEPRYPLHLLTPNTKNRIHSQFNNLETIRQFSPGPRAALAPAEASRRGLADGDMARVFNGRGELRLPVEIDCGVPEGSVVVTNGWWLSDGGAVNLLSRARETDMGYGAAFHDCLVEVAKA
jgi:anaerobic selenocysteine-containing dehydrogenase